MNAIPKKEYDAIKNDRTYAVITYDIETNKRHCTYSHLSLTQATNFIIEQQKYGRRAILLHNIESKLGHSWNIDDYEKHILESKYTNVVE